MFLRNRHRLDTSPRYRIAGLVALLYASVAGSALAAAVSLSGLEPLIPYVALSPALAVYAVYDLGNEARRILPELAGPAGLAASAPAIALAGGWSWPAAAALWVIMMARSVPSVSYVRARLRLERGERIARGRVWLWHVLAVAAVGALYARALSPFLTVLALVALAGRAGGGLSSHRRQPVRARYIGFTELGFGLGYVIITVAGFRLGF